MIHADNDKRLLGPDTIAPKTKDPELVAFGEHLRKLRYDAGLTQEELAYEAGLHWTYIGQIERGERNLTYRNIQRLAHGLRLDAAELIP